MRSLAEVEAAFNARVLTGLPEVSQPVSSNGGGEPLPADALLEPVRRLYTSLRVRNMFEGSHGAGGEGDDGAGGAANGGGSAPWGKLFARGGAGGSQGAPRSILFVSADSGDGKSSLATNLALVARDAGERVAVVDADLRRPVQAQLLDVKAPYGLIDVLAGHISLEAAMPFVGPAPRISAPQADEWGSGDGGVATAVAATTMTMPGGLLRVLTSGAAPANPPALLASPRMGELLQVVSDEHDFTLVDGPPPLAVSDVIPLLRLVDGIVVVVRFGHTRKAAAERLVELLHGAASAPVLGVVATGVPVSELRRHGLWSPYTYDRSDWRSRLSRS
jgi:Mrp family chromosome partitioning ATPase